MKRKKLKVFAVILAVTMMVTSAVGCFNFAIIAKAASGKCGDNLTWSYNESTGELKISGTGAMYDYGYDKVQPWWNNYGYSIKKITVGEGVTHIGDEAFSDCKDMETMTTEVYIGKSVKSIGRAAFYDCDNIRSIEIPDSVETIGAGAFDYCQGLKSVTIGKGLKTLADRDDVFDLGNFEHCNLIEKFVVSSSNGYFSSDSYGVLFNKDKTVLLRYPSGNSRESYEVPGSVVNLYPSSFENSRHLSTVKLPFGLKYIGTDTFYDCYNLETINIPDTVTSIGDNAFQGAKIWSTESNWEGGRQNGVLYIDNHLIELRCNGVYKVKDGTVTIAIGASGYYTEDETGLTSLTLPDSLKYIGNGAFEMHKNLTTVKLGKNIINIGMGAFDGCQITSVELPESVRSIEDDAFNSNKIEKIVIPENVENIGTGAFAGNPLKSIKVSTKNKNYISINDIALTNKEKTVFLQYALCSSGTQYSVPEGIKTIGERAFYSANNLKNVSLPKTVTVIAFGAFNSSALEKVIIPDSVTKICGYAFGKCKNLQEVTIGTGVRTIEGHAFIDCEKLKSVFVPETVEEIGYYGTFGCYMGFTDDDYAIQVLPMKDFTLYCVENSAAHEYALNAKLNFVLVKDSKTGDLNSDNKINSADALIVLQSSVGTVTLTAQQKTFADVNTDGKINSSDALMILQFAVGFIDRF